MSEQDLQSDLWTFSSPNSERELLFVDGANDLNLTAAASFPKSLLSAFLFFFFFQQFNNIRGIDSPQNLKFYFNDHIA